MDQKLIRNFSVIAHIDHGKSTLADRFLEMTGALQKREMEAQVLDSMDLERERGITIKAHAVRLTYHADDGETYILNLIDTPGHVDFSYEVTRSLAASEGALLIVDASQGVEAQTLANAYLAVENNLEIVPVINKIDLPGAQPDEAKRQIEDIVGLDASQAILASAKEGTGVHEILEAIVHRLPSPKGDPDAPLKALIFDSWYDPYKGRHHPDARDRRRGPRGHEDQIHAAGAGIPGRAGRDLLAQSDAGEELGVGEVGFVFAGIKTVSDAKIGDTITEAARPALEPFPGFKEMKPMVFAGLYPVEGSEYPQLRDALEKLRLNDASFISAGGPRLSYSWSAGLQHAADVGVVRRPLLTTVTLSTTGYGDITPVTTAARLTNVLLVTPVLFLIILVGTTLQVLTEQCGTNRRLPGGGHA